MARDSQDSTTEKSIYEILLLVYDVYPAKCYPRRWYHAGSGLCQAALYLREILSITKEECTKFKSYYSNTKKKQKVFFNLDGSFSEQSTAFGWKIQDMRARKAWLKYHINLNKSSN